MLSQNTLVWVGGTAASTVVVAGAVAGALLWTHPEFLWPSPPRRRSWPAPPSRRRRAFLPLPRRCARRHAPPAARRRPAASAAAPPLKPAFDVVNVDPAGRSGHRRPRRAERESRAARRRQDGRRGDGRRLGPVRHHSAGAGAGRSQPVAWPSSADKAAAGNVERGRRLGSRATEAKVAAAVPAAPSD